MTLDNIGQDIIPLIIKLIDSLIIQISTQICDFFTRKKNRFSASGVSPKWVKSKRRKRREKERKKERLKVGNNNGQLCIANANSGGARKATWANFIVYLQGVRRNTLHFEFDTFF